MVALLRKSLEKQWEVKNKILRMGRASVIDLVIHIVYTEFGMYRALNSAKCFVYTGAPKEKDWKILDKKV